MSPRNNVKIYNTLLRPVLEYGSIAFISTSKTNLVKIENIHTKALRLAQIPGYISKKLVLEAANSPFLIKRLIDLNSKRIKCIIASDENAKSSVLSFLASSTTRNKTKTPLDTLNCYEWNEVRTLVDGGGRGDL